MNKMIFMTKRPAIKENSCGFFLMCVHEKERQNSFFFFCHQVSFGLGFLGTSQWLSEMVRFSKTPSCLERASYNQELYTCINIGLTIMI